LATLFISFKGEDSAKREGLEGALRNLNTPVENRHAPISAREDKRPQGESAIRGYLRGLISGCHGAVLLLGPNAHTSAWVKYEMSVAQSLGVPVVVISTTESTSYQLPPGMPRGTEVHPWSARNTAIQRMISRR